MAKVFDRFEELLDQLHPAYHTDWIQAGKINENENGAIHASIASITRHVRDMYNSLHMTVLSRDERNLIIIQGLDYFASGLA